MMQYRAGSKIVDVYYVNGITVPIFDHDYDYNENECGMFPAVEEKDESHS